MLLKENESDLSRAKYPMGSALSLISVLILPV